jgi:hypothetical protein
MAAVKLSHPITGAKLQVADKEAAQFWLDRGYAEESAPAPKKTAKKSSSKSSK